MEDSASTKRLQLFPCQIQAASCATAISVAKLVSTYLRLVIAFVEKLVLREFVWNPRGRTKHGVLTKVDLHLLMHHLQDIIFSDKKMCESKEMLPGLPPESQKCWHWAGRMCLLSFESTKTVGSGQRIVPLQVLQDLTSRQDSWNCRILTWRKGIAAPIYKRTVSYKQWPRQQHTFHAGNESEKFEVKIAEAWTNQWCSPDFLILPGWKKYLSCRNVCCIGTSGLNRQTSRLILASWLQKQP